MKKIISLILMGWMLFAVSSMTVLADKHEPEIEEFNKLEISAEYVKEVEKGAGGANNEVPLLVSFSNGKDQVVTHQGEGYLMNYISLVYKYIAVIAGSVAVLMMVVGGFEIMISGPNSDGVTNGRNRIVGAFIGLVMLFSAALILRTINPYAYSLEFIFFF